MDPVSLSTLLYKKIQHFHEPSLNLCDGNKYLYLVFVGMIFFSQHLELLLQQLGQYLALLLKQLGQQHLDCFVRTAGQQHLD
jgi:hypothetical protein